MNNGELKGFPEKSLNFLGYRENGKLIFLTEWVKLPTTNYILPTVKDKNVWILL